MRRKTVIVLIIMVFAIAAMAVAIFWFYQKNWIERLIAQQEAGPVANPPASLTQCEYKNQSVYYLPPRSSDVPSFLYNENGNVICSPDGGFTGRGDEKCPDFFGERTNCEIIWQDARSYP